MSHEVLLLSANRCSAPDPGFPLGVSFLSAALREGGNEVRWLEHDFAQRSPNWIADDPVPEFTRVVERLRCQGVAGPLWSYFAILQPRKPVPAASLPFA